MARNRAEQCGFRDADNCSVPLTHLYIGGLHTRRRLRQVELLIVDKSGGIEWQISWCRHIVHPFNCENQETCTTTL